jgi:hypothetical protein
VGLLHLLTPACVPCPHYEQIDHSLDSCLFAALPGCIAQCMVAASLAARLGTSLTFPLLFCRCSTFLLAFNLALTYLNYR